MTQVFLTGVALLALSFVLHVVVWRAWRPRRQIATLVLLAAVIITLALATLLAARSLLPPSLELSASDLVRLALFYLSCSIVYVILFSAVESESPSLAVVSYLAEADKDGRSEDDLAAHFVGIGDFASRIDLMEASGFIQIDGDHYRLTRQGHVLGQLFELGSHVFGLPRGG